MLNMLNIHAKYTKSAMLTRQPRGALNLQLAGFLVLFSFEFLAAILCNPEFVGQLIAGQPIAEQ